MFYHFELVYLTDASGGASLFLRQLFLSPDSPSNLVVRACIGRREQPCSKLNPSTEEIKSRALPRNGLRAAMPML